MLNYLYSRTLSLAASRHAMWAMAAIADEHAISLELGC